MNSLKSLSYEEILAGYCPQQRKSAIFQSILIISAWKTRNIKYKILQLIGVFGYIIFYFLFSRRRIEAYDAVMKEANPEGIKKISQIQEKFVSFLTKKLIKTVSVFDRIILEKDTKALLVSADPLSSDASKKGVIIFLHGGGMMIGSSTIYTSYLIAVSKELKVPVLSIDYKLAPEYKYPVAINEIYSCYLWLLKYGHEIVLGQV